LKGEVVANKIITFSGEYDNGNSGASKTINWNNGKQKLTLNSDTTLSFTAPTNGIGNFTLKMVQDATGDRTVT